jgi:uncharacterized protein (TIGR00369 family)
VSDAAERVRSSFAKQAFMGLLGARIASVSSGEVVIELPFRADLVQQHGYLHAGVTTAIADSACGYAALSVMDEDAAVLSVEYKVNLLAPAQGVQFLATGRVLRAGKTVVVVVGDVSAVQADGSRRSVLHMQGTMMAVRGRGISD